MIGPISSGRTWERHPGNHPTLDPGRSVMRWLRDRDDLDFVALFKTPPADAPAREGYAIAMDRVAFVLGQEIGLPVAPVYLEEFEGEYGAVLELIENSISLKHAEERKMRITIANMEDVPLCVAFDYWLANMDRVARNILLQPYPKELAHGDAREYVLHLIDHGYTGLWPVGKFGLTGDADVPAQVELGDAGETLAEALIRKRMHGGYLSVFRDAPEEVRVAAYERIKDVPDRVVNGAVEQVPDALMSSAERLLTGRMLRARRDRIDSFCQAAFG